MCGDGGSRRDEEPSGVGNLAPPRHAAWPGDRAQGSKVCAWRSLKSRLGRKERHPGVFSGCPLMAGGDHPQGQGGRAAGRGSGPAEGRPVGLSFPEGPGPAVRVARAPSTGHSRVEGAEAGCGSPGGAGGGHRWHLQKCRQRREAHASEPGEAQARSRPGSWGPRASHVGAHAGLAVGRRQLALAPFSGRGLGGRQRLLSSAAARAPHPPAGPRRPALTLT